MQRIKAKSVLGYFIFPRVLPRARGLFASGFGYIAFLMASVYAIVRLLPANHAYLNPRNIGQFGIRHVVAEAANNLVLRKENIDQIAVFVILMVGIVVLLSQFLLLIYMYVIHPYIIPHAIAQTLLTGGLFNTPDPQTPGVTFLQDRAFQLLDGVFGVPKVFCNTNNICTEILGSPQVRQPFHVALHEMFRFYSTGMLIIGAMIFLYFLVVIVLETAATGTPFGERFQNGWVPIRLVVALGLLMPINLGLSSGQYIVLYVAKMGSGFATNGWLVFNRTLGLKGVKAKNPTGEDESLLALPTAPDITPVVMSMAMVHACAYAEWNLDKNYPKFDLVSHPPPPHEDFKPVRAYFAKKAYSWMQNQKTYQPIGPGTTYEQALDFYENANIVIYFGEWDQTQYSSHIGNIFPRCGKIKITISDVANVGKWQTMGGADAMQRFYYNLVRDMWHRPAGSVFGASNTQLIEMSQRFIALSLRGKWTGTFLSLGNPLQCEVGCGFNLLPNCTRLIPADPRSAPCFKGKIPAQARQFIINNYQSELNLEVVENWDLYNKATTEFDMTPELLDGGWVDAPNWYPRINLINGGWVTSVIDIPAPLSLPAVMEEVQRLRMEHSTTSASADIFSPHLPNGQKVAMAPLDITKAIAMNDYFQWWNEDAANQGDSGKIITGSVFRDTMNMMFGTNSLFAMRGKNSHIHPLAQLSVLGKGLVDSAVRNVGLSIFSAAMGGPAKILNPLAGTAIEAISGFLVTTAFVGLTAGFILFYILPFMPFLYFFFAAAEWVKAIFEAMVGVPLWALAHLRIDGEGLPGDSAANGYFLILEIFLRPILTIFGLIAAISIFTAQVRVLNMIWLLVIDNLTGFSTKADTTITVISQFEINRDIIDQFFFTVVYAMVVYMLATAAFKLIDNIPKSILRWAGSGVSSFGDLSGDAPVEGLQRYAALGGITLGKDTTKALQGAAKGGGNILEAMFRPK